MPTFCSGWGRALGRNPRGIDFWRNITFTVSFAFVAPVVVIPLGSRYLCNNIIGDGGGSWWYPLCTNRHHLRKVFWKVTFPAPSVVMTWPGYHLLKACCKASLMFNVPSFVDAQGIASGNDTVPFSTEKSLSALSIWLLWNWEHR